MVASSQTEVLGNVVTVAVVESVGVNVAVRVALYLLLHLMLLWLLCVGVFVAGVEFL